MHKRLQFQAPVDFKRRNDSLPFLSYISKNKERYLIAKNKELLDLLSHQVKVSKIEKESNRQLKIPNFNKAERTKSFLNKPKIRISSSFIIPKRPDKQTPKRKNTIEKINSHDSNAEHQKRKSIKKKKIHPYRMCFPLDQNNKLNNNEGLRPNDTNKELIYSSTSHSPVSSKNARRDERKDSNIYSIESVADSSNYSETNMETSKLIDNKILLKRSTVGDNKLTNNTKKTTQRKSEFHIPIKHKEQIEDIVPTKVLNNKFFDDFHKIKRMNNMYKKIKSNDSSAESWKESSSISSSSGNQVVITPPKDEDIKTPKQENRMLQNLGRNSKILIQASFKLNEKMIIDMAQSNFLL